MNPEKQVKLMDSGTVRFQAEGGLPGALNHVMTEMGKDGGTVRKISETDAVLDASGTWRRRIITAHVEPSGDGYAASFQEGNGLTRAGKIACCAIALLLVASILACFGGWWRLPCCLVVAGFLLYFLTAPEDACRRRMGSILHELGKS